MTERIDIVDDDLDHLSALSDLVETAAHGVRGFSAASDLLGSMSALPDMVISDLRMPGIDGIGLIHALRERALAVPFPSCC